MSERDHIIFDTANSLSDLRTATFNTINLLSTTLRSIDLAIKYFDQRRQYLVECIYRELCKHLTEFVIIFLEEPNQQFNISQFIENCLHPSEIPSSCKLQSMFFDLYTINTSKSMNQINKLMLKTPYTADIMNSIFQLFEIIIEDIYISAAAIDIPCNKLEGGCNEPNTMLCEWSSRNSNLILYYTFESISLKDMINKYCEIADKYFKDDKTISLIIDFNIIITDNSYRKVSMINLDDIQLALERAQKRFKAVCFRNTRSDKLSIDDKLRDYVTSHNNVLCI